MIYVVRLLPSVKLHPYMPPAGIRLTGWIDSLCGLLKRDITITCGTEAHEAPDPHASGEAFDVGVVGWSASDIQSVLMDFKAKNGPLFYIQYEVKVLSDDPAFRRLSIQNDAATSPHLHLQRAKDTVYPPVV